MPSKTNRSPDGKHVQFSSNPTCPMPEDWFQPGDSDGDDNYGFCPQYFGRVMLNPGGGGSGAAYFDEEYGNELD